MRAERFTGEQKLEGHKLAEIWAESERSTRLDSKQIFLHLLRQAGRATLLSPLTSLLSVVTISFSLFLFSAFLMLIQNFTTIVSGTTSDVTMSLYISDGTPAERVEELKVEVQGLPEVESVALWDKARALEEFKRSVGGDSTMLLGLEEANPLPISLEVKIREKAISEETFERISNLYKNVPYISSVQYGRGMVAQLGKLLRAARIGAVIGVLAMLLVTGFIISNTIRLALYAHRDEIEIMELVGATDRYIQAPYLIEGTVEGLVAAVLGLLLLWLVTSVFDGALISSGIGYLFGSGVSYLGFFGILFVLAAGAVIGFLGSYLAVRRYSLS